MKDSMMTDVRTTTRTSEPTSPRRVVLVSEAVSSFWVSPIRLETAMPRIEASVMTPNPPI